MTLYFDFRLSVGEVNSIYTFLDWHRQHGILAVASYNSEKGGAVHICDELVSISITLILRIHFMTITYYFSI